MQKRKIFKKKKSKNFQFYFFLTLIFFIFVFFIINNNLNSKFIIIPEYLGSFYIIPKDKEGQKVLNTDKRSLNLQSKEIIDNKAIEIKELFYSIQFFTNSEYSNVNQYLNKFINSQESIFKKDEFYIMTLNSEVGFEYFLLYKNFMTRDEAYDYCSKYLSILEKCLIVDIKKFYN